MVTLVTGAGGMVGSHMVERLYQDGAQVVGTYYKPTVDMKEINPEITLIECDIRYPENIERIMFQYKPDFIYHLAAQSYPTVSWEKPYETMDTNINGTIAVFEAVKKLKEQCAAYDPVVTVACSSAEYGQTLEELDNPYVKEDAQLKPLHPYGVSKVGQDLLSYQYWMNDKIKCIRARIFNTTGTRKVNDVTSDFTRRAIEQLNTGAKEHVLRVGNINTRRAIMDVGDLVNGLILLSQKGQYGEVYNISSEQAYSMKDIIRMIEEQLDTHFELEVDPSLLRTTDEKIIIGDVTKLKKDTSWEQRIPLEQTVTEMLNYWRVKMRRDNG